VILARVVGNVIATVKLESYRGQKLLVLRPETPDGTPEGEEILAIDGVGAGVGERVLVLLEGRGAGEVMGVKSGAVDAAVVGVVDRVDLLPL
jgi:ethanolamine utilization protein EutN